MSDLALAIRKGVAVAGFVIAGAGFLAMVLPFRVHASTGTHNRTDAPDYLACPTPVADAFDDAGDGADWFAYEPNTGVILSSSTFCVRKSQRRLSWGAAAVVFGGVVGVSQRRHFDYALD